jgi:hypothetical protein
MEKALEMDTVRISAPFWALFCCLEEKGRSKWKHVWL